mmetsp:Transcript_30367/g.78935  ORF Transcript_30367/g.78935 Transcript_30367/m.78935 type:complete len:349 (+) Transcript_30367:430-1476(+)
MSLALGESSLSMASWPADGLARGVEMVAPRNMRSRLPCSARRRPFLCCSKLSLMPSRMSGWTAGASAGSAPAGCGPLVAALVMHAEVSETSWIVSGSSLGFVRARSMKAPRSLVDSVDSSAKPISEIGDRRSGSAGGGSEARPEDSGVPGRLGSDGAPVEDLSLSSSAAARRHRLTEAAASCACRRCDSRAARSRLPTPAGSASAARVAATTCACAASSCSSTASTDVGLPIASPIASDSATANASSRGACSAGGRPREATDADDSVSEMPNRDDDAATPNSGTPVLAPPGEGTASPGPAWIKPTVGRKRKSLRPLGPSSRTSPSAEPSSIEPRCRLVAFGTRLDDER